MATKAHTAKQKALATVTMRLEPHRKEELVRAAQKYGLSTTRLSRVLVEYGVSELAKGNVAVQRVVKGSRDA